MVSCSRLTMTNIKDRISVTHVAMATINTLGVQVIVGRPVWPRVAVTAIRPPTATVWIGLSRRSIVCIDCLMLSTLKTCSSHSTMLLHTRATMQLAPACLGNMVQKKAVRKQENGLLTGMGSRLRTESFLCAKEIEDSYRQLSLNLARPMGTRSPP